MRQKIGHILSSTIKSQKGFTLLEAMLSVVLLGLVAFGISAPYLSGFQALDVQADRMLLDSQLRSRMEVLIGTDFDALANGSEVVIVQGQNFTLTWTIANVDLDGDAVAESSAKQITVSITERPGRTLNMIVVDNEDKIKKIS
jgi:prepilin-type N-terminal cleavage/methylation domain-containing protein